MENNNSTDIYKLFLENIPYPVWIQDIDTKIIFINDHYENLYNVKACDVIGKKTVDVLSKEKSDTYNEQLKNTLITKKVTISEVLIKGLYFRTYIFPILDIKQETQGIAGIVIDINEKKQKQLELIHQKNILRTIIDTLPEAIFYKDENSKYLGYNKAFLNNFKNFHNCNLLDDDSLLKKTDLDLMHNKHRAMNFYKQDKKILKTKKPISFENCYRHPDGHIITEESIKTPIIDESGNIRGIVGISRDITQHKTLEEKLRYLSEIDALTDLYNRNSFEEKIKKLNKTKYHPLGIIMGDVNGLKLINDTLGHLEGDNLLRSISNVLRSSCSESEYVFRWGGDEFIILIPNADELKCDKLIKKILNDCKKYNYKYMQLSISLGTVVKYEIDDNIYDCINKAEEKVYRHKLLDNKSIKRSIMDSLLKSLEEKNLETNEHAKRVTKYALALGQKLNFKISELDELILVARLHDIGKIGISEDILLKPGSLTSEEFEIMKTHTEKGYRIINASSELYTVAKCVLTHHERWDGKGYPLGLKGDEIPLVSRIINIADSFDVMTNNRPYKNTKSKNEAIKELQRCAGTQFDPTLVYYFIEYINDIEE
ncbi:HD domain-containing phosphohydrolase [Terrisporobacter glycolicus]|uniref:PAS domain S-box-containing protein/diguanylate cyclase (GGDEF) domain-containing protein n=1 Tax=Terrisporobacter glycolicus ATCC 14880 = DSM 1288 TaxID=1121315 RepID=A0ABZ2EXH1_9FIRM|nr:HD domain-containing phosphohydrolase [Terrisporobacter glycolicus]